MDSVTTFTYNSVDYDIACVDGNITEEFINTSINSDPNSGYITTRPRFTKFTRVWTLNYTRISTDDKETIQDLEKLVFTYTPFTWHNPLDSTTSTVYFKDSVKYTAVQYNQWNVSISLVEQ